MRNLTCAQIEKIFIDKGIDYEVTFEGNELTFVAKKNDVEIFKKREDINNVLKLFFNNITKCTTETRNELVRIRYTKICYTLMYAKKLI
jgi:hypothetical protein